ncbi:DUF2971 domain-containing protein [Vibrio kanaloae]|uniref:DUF2971 domain-containing protein n=1 Tax=Vibrio TaxID=662 RepID=UPI000C8611F6|nr:DUF2971 domain-containing protein [Vibrio cyclitrophicus]PME92973.1 hypothetical protein BCV26_13180 [Vibrio cyclitrophicus]
MENPEVKALFKYRSLRAGVDADGKPIYNKNTIKMLQENTAWMANPNTFNDPFDCNYRPLSADIKNGDKLFSKNIELTEVEAAIYQAYKNKPTQEEEIKMLFRLTEYRNNQIQNAVQSHRVFSLSEDWDQILLWSHYADNHSGVCLGYERSEGSLLSSNMCRPVRYRKRYLRYDHSDYLNFLERNSTNSGPWQDGFNIITNALFTKSEDWFYEKEWRLVQRLLIFDKSVGFNLEIDAPLRCVVFGCMTPKEDKEYVQSTLGDSVRYFQAWKSKEHHTLDIYPLEECEARIKFHEEETEYIAGLGGDLHFT